MASFIKNLSVFYKSPEVKWLLYLGIAFLMSVYNELSKYDSFSDIPPIKVALIIIAAVLQALIAWRAFIDQTISRDDADRTPPKG